MVDWYIKFNSISVFGWGNHPVIRYSGIASSISPAVVRNIPDIYSHVTNAQTPAVIKQVSAVTTQKTAANTQTPAAIEQMHTATAQAPVALASPICNPSTNQAPMSQPAIFQSPASLFPPMPAGQSLFTLLGNSQIGKPGKEISPKPNLEGTAAQAGSLPNGKWTDRLSNNENHALNSLNEFRCMKKDQLALCQCKLGSSQAFIISSHPSQPRKGNSRCNSDSWFPNAMPSNNHALQVH
ncbi:hypothetical protein DSO57_1025640 [Entomophthora muscae]|uniref:Uncharacterized protein n=1 Tax=Entomophthora muscae TaxID=34485 RepID=A0ACC2RGW9_9FUNG|nr:hypothetical protein DSO57_1025640 [Entomophthora muscae]